MNHRPSCCTVVIVPALAAEGPHRVREQEKRTARCTSPGCLWRDGRCCVDRRLEARPVVAQLRVRCARRLQRDLRRVAVDRCVRLEAGDREVGGGVTTELRERSTVVVDRQLGRRRDAIMTPSRSARALARLVDGTVRGVGAECRGGPPPDPKSAGGRSFASRMYSSAVYRRLTYQWPSRSIATTNVGALGFLASDARSVRAVLPFESPTACATTGENFAASVDADSVPPFTVTFTYRRPGSRSTGQGRARRDRGPQAALRPNARGCSSCARERRRSQSG